MYTTALKLFQHTLDVDKLIASPIGIGMLNLVNQELIESTSTAITEAMWAGDRVWLTADLHFRHANIIAYCDRPFHNADDMDAALLKTLSKVPSSEYLIIVGDVFMGNFEKSIALLRQVPGKKILIAGNHDFNRNGICKLLETNVFDAIVPFLFWPHANQNRLTLLTHYPVHLPEGYRNAPVLNYHGHLHEKTVPSTEMVKYMNVGWDINHALNCL